MDGLFLIGVMTPVALIIVGIIIQATPVNKQAVPMFHRPAARLSLPTTNSSYCENTLHSFF